MFNVTVLKMRDLIKYLVGIIVTTIIVIFATRYFLSLKSTNNETKSKNLNISAKNLSEDTLKKPLDDTIASLREINNKSKENIKEEKDKRDYLEGFLETELSAIKGMKENKTEEENELKEENNENIQVSSNETNNLSTEKIEENSKDTTNTENKELTLAQNNLKSEVITKNPIPENANVKYDKVKIKNQTSYDLTEDVLKPDIKIENKNIIIFHTHSCESYTPSELYQYTQTGNFRTTDLNYTVTRVGTELSNYLKKYNINVVHDTSYHDYPSYNGSYTKSLKTVENILKTTPSDIIIDLHRDAIGSRSDYAPIVKIGDDYAAQIMFVIGTNEGGLYHPNWKQNLKFAVKVQEKAEEMYPGLFKPIMLTKSRYNQHIGKFANIIEVGATGNTLEQTLTSMKYLSNVLNEVLK